MRTLNVILCALALIFVQAIISEAKPAPPERLAKTFEEFSELEGKYESGKWEEARESANEINQEFRLMLPQIRETVAGNVVKDFTSIFYKLQQALNSRDGSVAEEHFIALQKLFLKIMDSFDYKVPPVLEIIDQYIDEAMEALEKKDYIDVISEMNEVDGLFELADEYLAGKQAAGSDVKNFSVLTDKVRKAGQAKDAAGARSTLNELSALSKKFLKMF